MDRSKPCLFIEIQRLHQWWIWCILFALDILFICLLFRSLGNAISNVKSYQPVILIGVLIFLFLLQLFLLLIRLEVEIREEGLYFRFFPFIRKRGFLPWKNIQKIYVREYSPLNEYGGWGMRIGLFGNGQAYSVSGHHGIQVDLIDNRRILFGTRRPQEAAQALGELFTKTGF